MITPTIQDLVKQFDLKPHPEGGYYNESYRSDQIVKLGSGLERSAATAIHFLICEGNCSRLHKIDSDESELDYIIYIH